MVGNLFYGDTHVEPEITICNHKTDDLPPQMIILNTLIPILMNFFTFSPFKMYYFEPIATDFSSVEPDISQSETTFHIGVRFATVYRGIYCRKFFTLTG